jgi:hypothetical protein
MKENDWIFSINMNNVNDTFVDIEDGYLIFRQPAIKSCVIDARKMKLSSLRGKVSKQTKEEIDEQLKNLRSEW